jgi:hypothetical protein
MDVIYDQQIIFVKEWKLVLVEVVRLVDFLMSVSIHLMVNIQELEVEVEE